MADELQLAYDFYKEGELSEQELDAQYEVTNTHIEGIEFKNMLSDEGDSLSAVICNTALKESDRKGTRLNSSHG